VTPAERAAAVAKRLNAGAALGLKWQKVTVAPQGQVAVIKWGSDLLVTADLGHAKRNKTTPLKLARAWQKNLQTAIWWASWDRPVAAEDVPIFEVIFENARALQVNDIDSMFATTDINAPPEALKFARAIFSLIMNKLTLTIEIDDLFVKSRTATTVQVDTIQTTRGTPGDGFKSNRICAIETLKKNAKGEWKLGATVVQDVEYLVD
jgi:hypothetical protein